MSTEKMGTIKKSKRKTYDRNLVSHESYQEFFDEFGIAIQDLCTYGIEHTETATTELASEQWNILKKCLFEGEKIKIGDTGRTCYDYLTFRTKTQKNEKKEKIVSQEKKFYTALYQKLFPRGGKTQDDGSGNDFPKRFIERATGYGLNNKLQEGRPMLVHYTISHIFGERTKNPLLFSALWNIALTPSVIDPFTDEAAVGPMPDAFKPIFKNMAIRKFRKCIEDYNMLLDEYNIKEKIKDFFCDGFTEKELASFKSQA